MSEQEFIKKLTHRSLESAHAQIKLGIGDDAGILSLRYGTEIVIAKDILTEGVDFIFPDCDPVTLGRKALAVNLSDMAAMACRPVAALVGLVVPLKDGAAIAQGIMDGVSLLAKKWNVGIIGGDTNSWSNPNSTVVSITILGEPFPGIKPISRSGARPGDVVFVTGTLGGSIYGKQFHFSPRIDEAFTIAQIGEITSMIDLSDGLSKDAGHLATASGVALTIEAEQLPVSSAARSGWNSALSDGEDFELCFTCSPELAKRFLELQPCLPVSLTKIGFVHSGSGLYLKHASGLIEPMPVSGFEHRI